MRVCALVGDLMDRSRISAAIPDVVFVRDAAACADADVVIVDLARSGKDVGALRAAVRSARIVCFGPHVDEESAAAARAGRRRLRPPEIPVLPRPGGGDRGVAGALTASTRCAMLLRGGCARRPRGPGREQVGDRDGRRGHEQHREQRERRCVHDREVVREPSPDEPAGDDSQRDTGDDSRRGDQRGLPSDRDP